MRENYSFRKRMLFSFWIVLLLALLLPPWYYCHVLAQEALEETKTSAVRQLNLVHQLLSHEKNFDTAESLQSWLMEVGRPLGARITYVADSGDVLADSQVPFSEIPNLDNHANRPEIVEARGRETGVAVRLSRTIQAELIYAARTISQKGALPSGILRLAAPLSRLKEPLDRLRNSFLLFLALVLAATVLLSYALIRRLNEPISAMIDTAEAISTRDFKRRIHSGPGQEFFPLTQAINKMADSIESHIQTITEQKQQLEAVFNAMREGVMVLDLNGKIRDVNRAFSELIFNASDVTGRRPMEVIVNLELQKLCDRLMGSAEIGADVRPHNLQIALSEERTYDVNVVGVSDMHREICAVVVFHDISELKRLEKVRQDFVANVSHELRTPLTSIKGYTETLLSEPMPNPETISSFLRIILKNTNHMVKMVEELLQLARLDAHDKPSKLVPVNAASALLTAWKACEHHADAKELRLENNLHEDGVWVSADFDQLVQVFRNLMENAIRYSPSGEKISISCQTQGDKIAFSLQDRGPGIPTQHQKRIFERFYRVAKHRSDHRGSTGLGLAICRHIVRNHGGGIWVRSPSSEDAKGTTFFFTLMKASPGREASMAK